MGHWCAAVCALLILGCATLEPRPVADADAGRQSVPSGARGGDAQYYRGANGAVLGYIRYTAPIATTAIVYLHGLEDHGGWFAGAANRLQARGYDVYLLDRRGSGINRENRGFQSGDIDAYPTWIDDIQAFLQPLAERYPRVFLVGHSWGGKLAFAYGLARPGGIDGVVLIAPGLREKVGLGMVGRWSAWRGADDHPQPVLAMPIQPAMRTTTPAFLDYIERDPLRLDRATARFFDESGRLDEFIDAHLSESRKPILLLLAGQDQIVDNEGVLTALRQGDPTLLETRIYEDQPHALPFDAVDRLVDDMDAWFKKQQLKRAPAG
jgi:alpha-beta hydrolase superfamily lysophospholipase